MKTLLIAAMTLLGAVSAQAASLEGKVLSCSADLGKLGGKQNITYQFIKAVDGKQIAVIQLSGANSGNFVENYFMDANKLVIALDKQHITDDTAMYDLTNPKAIQRDIQYCVMPENAGPNAKQECITTKETCMLN